MGGGARGMELEGKSRRENIWQKVRWGMLTIDLMLF